MVHGKKNRYRADAEFIATYGWPPEWSFAAAAEPAYQRSDQPESDARASAERGRVGEPETASARESDGLTQTALARNRYEFWYGLWMNRRRAQAFQAIAAWKGARAARKGGMPSPDMFDALADDPGEAVALASRYESDLRTAEMMSARDAGMVN